MGQMNRKMNIPQMQKIMQEFEKQEGMMGMKEEMMNDAMDDAFADDDDEDAEEEVLGSVGWMSPRSAEVQQTRGGRARLGGMDVAEISRGSADERRKGSARW